MTSRWCSREASEILITTEYILVDPDPGRREYLAHRCLSHEFASTYGAVQAIKASERRAVGIGPDEEANVRNNYRRRRKFLAQRFVERGRSKADAQGEADVELNEWARHREWNGLSVRATAEAVGRRPWQRVPSHVWLPLHQRPK